MAKEERLDRSLFKRQTHAEAADTMAFWRKQTDAYKLKSAYHLSLRAFGFDPADEPRLDRAVFSMRRHEQ